MEIEGNINSARYVEILEQNSWSVVENYFSERPCHRIFHDDSSAVQDSGFMVQWKGQNSVPFWLGPSHSQDINIIENIVGERWKWSWTEERRTFSHGQLWLVLWRGSVWTALSAAHAQRVPVSLAFKQNQTRLQGKWMHNPILIRSGEQCVFISCDLVRITVQQMKLSLLSAMFVCKGISLGCL